ncbi:hypothetical protein B0I33_10550 [Prauserella shujinwangii]|uniref:Uncharacterized protein n=1 Tax=Prauserella shujinwangii TaxID=1453103 RepID=A0A2T0LUF3_9PSEU|nr:hypothetical protein [Prauserella shujinwangii]PRX47472.1 hypothetical protein B0I33_10550 [Prauserella shujinwangii]
MDERELETLFREAPGDPPPARFTAADIAGASHRATVRRRSAIAAASAAFVVIVGGVGVATTALNDTGSDQTTAGAPALGEAERGQAGLGQPGNESGRLPNAQGFPDASPKQGGDATGENGPRAEGTSGCDKVDRELAIALAGELPVTADAAGPGFLCPAGTRSAGFRLDDGTVTAVLAPPGKAVQLPELPDGARVAEAATAGGGTVLVISVPGGPPAAAPHAGELSAIAAALAERL